MSFESGAQECRVCGASDHLSWCSRCHLVTYCGKEHQVQDWKNHKKNCNASIVKSVKNLKLQDENLKSGGARVAAGEMSATPQSIGLQWSAPNSVKLEPYLPEEVTPKDNKRAKSVWKALQTQGVCVLNEFLPKDQAEKVYNCVVNMYDRRNNFVDGEVVKQGSNLGSDRVRWDHISWVDESYAECPELQLMCKKLDKLIDLATKHSDHVVEARTKPMVACYPGEGAHYKRHVDNPSGDGRLLTCLYYLNKNWNYETDGGLLYLYPNGMHRVQCDPSFNKVCIFFSDNRNPHEVLPSYRKRFAITCWYFDREERQRAIENWKKASKS